MTDVLKNIPEFSAEMKRVGLGVTRTLYLESMGLSCTFEVAGFRQIGWYREYKPFVPLCDGGFLSLSKKHIREDKYGDDSNKKALQGNG